VHRGMGAKKVTMRFCAALLTTALWCYPAFCQTVSTFSAVGLAEGSCGEYLQTADAERSVRPPEANTKSIFTMKYLRFVSIADGVLTGANLFDATHHEAGKTSDSASRMVWLETYCHQHPLDGFVEGVEMLRWELINTGKEQRTTFGVGGCVSAMKFDSTLIRCNTLICCGIDHV
jgi:hypothetical protein